MATRVQKKRAGSSGGAAGESETAKSAKRRHEVILAAYRTIAEKGFEGLRMREIATRAGMDHATLHYYFAGKEALIRGVLEYIVRDLSIGRSAAAEAGDKSARKRLAAHFDALVQQVRETPEMFVVLAEINARSLRDPAVRAVVTENDEGWKRFLIEILEEGIRREEFQVRFGAEAGAEAIIALVRGLTTTFADDAEAMKLPLRQLLTWLKTK